MTLAAALKQLRTLAPIAAVGIAVATLLICVLSAKLGAHYMGDLTWPYLSDLVRDAPAYYVFALGATVVAVLLALNWGFNFQFQCAVLLGSGDEAAAAARDRRMLLPTATIHLLRTNVALGALSMLGLVLLAFFSATSFPTMHSVAAQWFLLLLSVAVVLNTFISYKIQKFVRAMTDPMVFTLSSVHQAPPMPEILRLQKFQRTFQMQFACAVVYFVAVVLYLPVGLAIVQDFKRLSVQECLDRDLGDDYCVRVVRHDAVDTELWNFEDDFAANQMRALAQLGCVFTLLAYSLSFATHDYDEELEKLAGRGLAQSTHFYNLAVVPTPPPSGTTGAPMTTATTMTLYDA